MPMSVNLSRSWSFFFEKSTQLRRKDFPGPAPVAMKPDDSYLRLSVSQLFLARQRSWGGDRIPAVKASVTMRFSGADQHRTLARLIRPEAATGHASITNYPLTDWLPYLGQSVEVRASLYQIIGRNNLLAAIDVVSEFASLVTPPGVSTALVAADKVAQGINKVVEANAKEAVLEVHDMLSPETQLPAGSRSVGPQSIAVVRVPETDLPAESLHLNESGQLCRDGQTLSGYDYLVLRLDACRERPDWRIPDIDEAIKKAYRAQAQGKAKEYKSYANQAITKLWDSPDFTTQQQKRLAQSLRTDFDEAKPGAVAEGDLTLKGIVGRHGLPSRGEVNGLTLEDLLIG
jgi:hypothetical protein